MNLKAKTIKILTLLLAFVISPISNFAQTTNIEPPKAVNQNEISQIEINCVFPIGSYCVCAHNLERHNLRFQASPLDWAGLRAKPNSKEAYSLKTVLHLFETKFADFFEKTQFYGCIRRGGRREVFDTKNNIEYHNSFNKKTPFNKAKREFRKTMLNRAKKVDEIMKNSDAIALISCRENTKEEFIDFINKFSKIYPNKKIYLINVRNTNSKKITQETLYEKGNLKVIEYRFKNQGKPYNWQGNHKGWDEVMKSIKLVRK